MTNIPPLGLFDEFLPATVEESVSETTVRFGVPGLLELSGVLAGNSISGPLHVVFGGDLYTGQWYIEKYTGQVFFPGDAPGPACEDLPALHCIGSAEYCSERVPFSPDSGPGYLNQPLNGETWENQYRSHIRRDLGQLVKYATAKVACKTVDWDYGNRGPLGLADMSEADGSIPGTSIGYPGHPPGSHEDGRDIDMAYYQVYAADNLVRVVGTHYEGYFDAYHLTGSPQLLDVWRTALCIAYLSEHPRVRVIGVDGKLGPILDDAFDALVDLSNGR